VLGDKVNIMLAAAAFNFKRMMNRYKIFFWLFFQRVFHTFYRLAGYFFFTKKIKMTFSGTTTYGSLSEAEANLEKKAFRLCSKTFFVTLFNDQSHFVPSAPLREQNVGSLSIFRCFDFAQPPKYSSLLW